MRPKPKVSDCLDSLELSNDRHLMFCYLEREHPDDPPRVLLEDYDSSQKLEDLSPGGSIWVYPEDLPRLVAWLESWLQAFRECAKEVGSKSPTPLVG